MRCSRVGAYSSRVDKLGDAAIMGRNSGGMIIAGIADKAPERLTRAIMNVVRD